MKHYVFVILSVAAYLQTQAHAGPISAPEKIAETAAPAPATPVESANDVDFDEKADYDADANDDVDNDDDDTVDDDEIDQHSQNEPETTTSNTSHVFNSTPENSTPSATPNLDAFMRAFEAIDQNVYNEIENFLENIVPKLPENNNPITNHLESAVFLFELYEKMKEPRDLNNSQEQHFLSEIENFLASNSFLLFNKPTAGRQDVEDDVVADQDGEEQNQEFELNDDFQDNNLDDVVNEEDAPEKSEDDENEEKEDKEEKPQENKVVAA